MQFVPLLLLINLAEILVQTEEWGRRGGGSDKLVDNRGTSQRVDEQTEFVLKIRMEREVGKKKSIFFYSQTVVSKDRHFSCREREEFTKAGMPGNSCSVPGVPGCFIGCKQVCHCRKS
jgi:hypothetical protein